MTNYPVMQKLLSSMSERTLVHCPEGAREIAPGVHLYVAHSPTLPTCSLYEPMICIVLQGAKEVTIGDRTLRYDPAACFIASLELPLSGSVVEASSEKPYMCASMSLDRDAIADLMPDVPDAGPGEDTATTGFAVTPVTERLLNPWSRLIELADTPADVAVMAPMLKREILFRMLQGPQAGVLRQIVRADSRLSQVRQAVKWIRQHFHEPLRVEALAEIAGMSPASFHRHFKAATALSPLQYQKMLRLQEARRLLVVNADATRTAYRVGYESPSQFSREYSRMFGVAPSRDAVRLRGKANEGLRERA